MAMLLKVGGNLMSSDEYAELKAGQLLASFMSDRKSRAKSVRIGSYEIRRSDLRGPAPARIGRARSGAKAAWTPAGIGKPLSIEIQNVYTGDCGTTWIGSNALLCTSAMKPVATFQKSPRAINLLRKDIAENQYVGQSAVEDGTCLIYHTPALVHSSFVFTVEMVVDRFPKEAFDQISKALGTASSLPVFASASLYLMAGSVITGLVGSLGEAIYDGDPFFRANEIISFGKPPYEDTLPGQMLLLRDEDEGSLSDFDLTPEGVLVSKKDGVKYKGDIPYVAVTVDGAERPDYKEFAATSAAIDLLDRFYHVKGSPIKADDILVSMRLFNDYQFAQKAADQSTIMKLHASDPDGATYKKAKELRDAYIKNIQSEEFKPKA